MGDSIGFLFKLVCKAFDREKYSYSLLLILSFSSFQCRKQKPQEQLPTETQTGAGTLGVKADGTVYKSYYPYPNAFATYTYENFPVPGQQGYFFSLGGSSGTRWGIGILTDSLRIFESQTYPLINNLFTIGKASASFDISGKIYYSEPYLQGELAITKLDPVNKVVSGIFWFDALDTLSNAAVKIREGRFDLHYTE